MWLEKKHELHGILKQGENFSLDERRRLIEIERELIRQTIPIYKQLQEEGLIEVITSPYYHPILPLLIDSNIARQSNPGAKLPSKLYFHRDDARLQIENGLTLYEEMFRIPARGMWPSELAISPAAAELISTCGINWVLADEALLSKTLGKYISRDDHGNLNNPELLCQPYRLHIGDKQLNIIFREVVTSNEISFAYGKRYAEEAATALYMRLKHVQQKLFNWDREGVVAIALDGENCWETYVQDGHLFLNELYKRLSEDESLHVCTVSDYLDRNPPSTELNNIHPGSWIGADFHIWIGDPLKNRAWELLCQTRRFLVAELNKRGHSMEVQSKAWEEIYTAEGSDWFWWFGEPNNSAEDHIFDQQFRLRLQNVYKVLGHSYPKELDIPILDQVFVHKQDEVAQTEVKSEKA